MKVKAKATAVLACCWSIAVLSFSPLAHAAADPHVLTQTCPNGDKIALNMNKKTLALRAARRPTMQLTMTVMP